MFRHELILERFINAAEVVYNHADEFLLPGREGRFCQISGWIDNARQFRVLKEFLPDFPVIGGRGEQVGDLPGFGF